MLLSKSSFCLAVERVGINSAPSVKPSSLLLRSCCANPDRDTNKQNTTASLFNRASLLDNDRIRKGGKVTSRERVVLLRCCTGRRNSTLPHSESLSRRRKPYPFTKRISEDVLERVRSRLRPIDCRGPGRPHRAAGREECSPCNLLDELLLFARARHIRINNHKMYLLTICLHDFLSCR